MALFLLQHTQYTVLSLWYVFGEKKILTRGPCGPRGPWGPLTPMAPYDEKKRQDLHLLLKNANVSETESSLVYLSYLQEGQIYQECLEVHQVLVVPAQIKNTSSWVN